jgi:hypothetical protein
MLEERTVRFTNTVGPLPLVRLEEAARPDRLADWSDNQRFITFKLGKDLVNDEDD